MCTFYFALYWVPLSFPLANIFSIYNELNDPTMTVMNRSVTIAVGLTTFVYLLIGFSGYFLYGRNVAGNMLQNFDIREPISALAQGSIGIAIILTFPLNIYPARFTLQTMLNREEHLHSPPPPTNHSQTIVLTLGLVFTAFFVAVYVPSISELFSFLGATTGSLIAFILPAIFYLRLTPLLPSSSQPEEEYDVKVMRRNRMICILMATGGTLLATITTFRSLQLFVQYSDTIQQLYGQE